MRSCPELIAVDTPFEASHTSIDTAIRTLVDLTERVEPAGGPDICGGHSGEEILIDIEVDGENYHRNWDGELCRRDQIRSRRQHSAKRLLLVSKRGKSRIRPGRYSR